MNRTIIRAVPLRFLIPSVVFVAFSLTLAAILWHESRQFAALVEEGADRALRVEMARLQRLIEGALATGDHAAAEREIAHAGALKEARLIATIDEDGAILKATRLAWKGRTAEAVLPGFDGAVFETVRRSQTPSVTAREGLLAALFPLNLRRPGEIRATRRGALYMEYDTGPLRARTTEIVYRQGGFIWLVGLGAMVLLMVGLNVYVSTPVRRLAAAAEDLPDGGEWTPLIKGRGEIAALAHTLRQAGESVRRSMAEQREAQGELERTARALRALSGCNGAILRATGETSLFDAVCQVIVDAGGYRMAWVGRREDDAEQSVTPVTHAGFENGYLERTRFSWGDNPYGQGPVGRSIQDGQPVLVHVDDPSFSLWRESAREHGYAAVVGLPIPVAGTVFGALAVYAGDADSFDERELALLRELAETLGHGIASLRNQQALRRSEAELRALNATLEQRIEQRTVELRNINRELESFTYSVSHDLRAPLRSMDGFSQILLRRFADVLPEEGQHYLRRVRAATRRMGHLIDDLLALSRIGRQDPEPVEVDITRMADEVLASLREAEPERIVDIHVARGMMARCDRRLARVALDNLIGNAWKYTGRREAPRIEVDAIERNGVPFFRVRDNGAGFDMNYADKLFAPFQRLHRMDEFEGNGIGLATVHRIIVKHGGEILAESAPGEGASFLFHFGAAPAEADEAATIIKERHAP